MKLYQAYIGVQQRIRCNDLAIPLDIGNRTGDSAREYELLFNLYRQHTEANDTDPWGLVSWKFEWKTSVSIESFIAFCKEKFAKGFECVFINPMIGNESMFLNVWEQGIAVGHIGMDIIFQHLRNVLNLPNPLAMSHAKFAFCNYFMATPRFWGKYFNFVEHCLTLLNREVENGTQVGRAFAASANYHRDKSITMRPFVIERLFSTFLILDKSLCTVAWNSNEQLYHTKFGRPLGSWTYMLSKIKNEAIAEEINMTKLSEWNRIRMIPLKSQQAPIIWQLDDPSVEFWC